jgi:predicted SAM-dependent methyltransferase
MTKKKTIAPKQISAKTRKAVVEAVTTPLPMAAPDVTRKLDLACGQSPREGFEGVDIWPKAQHVVDLMKYPWPFEDNSVFELHCSHYVEHIPMEYVDKNGNPTRPGDGVDALFKFFDECHRILVPGGFLTVIVPAARNNRAFQDPTHRRFIVAETFLYLAKAWREMNKLDHYGVKCDYEISVNPTIPIELSTRAEEVQSTHMNNYWNTVIDFHAKLKAI